MEDYSTIRKSDKYDMQSKEMVLWLSMGLPYECIHGTQMLQWDWEGVQHTLCRLNEKGEIIFEIYFLEESYYSNGKEIFMIALPFYEDGEMDIAMEIKKQTYFREED